LYPKATSPMDKVIFSPFNSRRALRRARS
jgi:hypothetical protein